MTEAIFGDEYITTTEKSFNIAERKVTLSGDSFDIKNENGTSRSSCSLYGHVAKLVWFNANLSYTRVCKPQLKNCLKISVIFSCIVV